MDKKTKELLKDFHSGTCIRAYDLLGCHRITRRGKAGYVFRVWAPNAKQVCVVGEFNFWNPEDLPMERLDDSVWEVFTTRGYEGCPYKYYITRPDGSTVYKADPYATRAACLPDTSSLICTEDKHNWGDGKWMRDFPLRSPLTAPMNIYEMHLGSWRRKEDGSTFTYAELAEPLTAYLKDMGYTHVEFMPLSEYPYDPSWGYQVTGYYAPTFRYGEPEGLRVLVDTLHRAGIGVILDWVPAHFPKDEQGLYEFDGTCCYELSDPTMNEHPDWTTRIFDFGKPEVKCFLVSNAVYWLEKFHIDGVRVDAVSSMLYLDYGRTSYKPNRFGGRENLEAMELLRSVNRAAFRTRPNSLMVAEESTAFPMITKPDFDGGLGFLFKWNMGWMNDTIQYMQTDPIYRKYKHNNLTFSMTYAFSENFILPLSHDEVVHGKASLINKMPGEYDQKFSNLRAMYAYMIAHPGKKLSFMGNELGQFSEWSEGRELDWMLLSYDSHRKLRHYVRALNRLYRESPPLWENDADWGGFQWISTAHRENGILPFRRIDDDGGELICLFNLSFRGREDFRIGLSRRGRLQCLLSSDHPAFGGEGRTRERAMIEAIPLDGMPCSAALPLPPLSAVFYRILDRPAGKKRRGRKKQGI